MNDKVERTLLCIVLITVLGATTGTIGHGLQAQDQPPRWYSRFATEGAKLEFVVNERDASANEENEDDSLPSYWLRIDGVSETSEFHLWCRSMGNEPVNVTDEEGIDSLSISDNGILQRSTADGHTEFLFQPEEVHLGELIEVCVISKDGLEQVFASVIPRPFIVKDDDGRQVELRLVNESMYEVIASGFQTEQNVHFYGSSGELTFFGSRYDDARKGLGFFVTDDGPMKMYWRAPRDDPGGNAQIEVRGRDSSLKAEVAWGYKLDPSATQQRDK